MVLIFISQSLIKISSFYRWFGREQVPEENCPNNTEIGHIPQILPFQRVWMQEVLLFQTVEQDLTSLLSTSGTTGSDRWPTCAFYVISYHLIRSLRPPTHLPTQLPSVSMSLDTKCVENRLIYFSLQVFDQISCQMQTMSIPLPLSQSLFFTLLENSQYLHIQCCFICIGHFHIS